MLCNQAARSLYNLYFGLFRALLLQSGSLSCWELSRLLVRSRAHPAAGNAVHHSICSQHFKVAATTKNIASSHLIFS